MFNALEKRENHLVSPFVLTKGLRLSDKEGSRVPGKLCLHVFAAGVWRVLRKENERIGQNLCRNKVESL